MSRTRPLAALAAMLTLAACAAPAGGDGETGAPTTTAATSETPTTAATSEAPEATPAAFPRTVEVPAGSAAEATTLVVPAEPHRIAALSYETAELVAALGLADRLVVVPKAVQNPVLTNHLEEMAAVPATVPTEADTDPEAIIALDPDLVLLSARHGLDTGAGKVLAEAGIPVLLLPNTWTDAADVVQDVRLVGQALGADVAADDLAGRLEAGLVPAAATGEPPRVLVLSNQAGTPFATAGAAFPLELLRLAGGADASADLGLHATGPIAAEQVVQADPDGILLVDMNGSGRASFAPLLDNPAVAGLPAVAEDHVTLVGGRQVQALGLDATIDGLAVLREWIVSL